MKYILLFSIFITTHLLATSQIILGTYSSQNSANQVKSNIDNIIKNDKRFKDFLVKNSIRTFVEQNGGYFIVTLKPINDIVTQHAILNRVKKTKFKDAFVVVLEKPTIKKPAIEKDEILQDEPKLKDIPIKTKVQIIDPQPIHKPRINLLDQYFNELVAIISILVLSIIYLLIKRRQQANDDELSMYIAPETIKSIKIDKTDILDIDNEDNSEKESVYELKTEGSISFDSIDENKIEDSITSNIQKKQLQKHTDTIKSDFKDFAGIRIMIAEDNIINQKVISGILSDSGIDIVIANDGQEVLDILKNDTNFCIILMDAHMPNIDGYEASKQIRANPDFGHITIIALSGDTAQDDINKMKQAGMQEHLEKPLKMDSLYDALNLYSYEAKVELTSKELDIVSGLEICGGDEEFYKEILNDFIKNYNDSNKYIAELISSNLFEAAQKLLLDISSLSKNIGALRVGELANKLRIALNTPQSSDHKEIYKEYAKRFSTLEAEVKEYL